MRYTTICRPMTQLSGEIMLRYIPREPRVSERLACSCTFLCHDDSSRVLVMAPPPSSHCAGGGRSVWGVSGNLGERQNVKCSSLGGSTWHGE